MHYNRAIKHRAHRLAGSSSLMGWVIQVDHQPLWASHTRDHPPLQTRFVMELITGLAGSLVVAALIPVVLEQLLILGS